MHSPKRIYLFVLLLVVVLASASYAAAQDHYAVHGIETILSSELHEAVLDWMKTEDYQITLNNPGSGTVAGTYYGITGTRYSGSIRIFPPYNEMRWMFDFPDHGSDFGSYMQKIVVTLKR